MSKVTSNSVESMMKLPFEYIIGMRNAYNKIVKEEDERRKKEEDKQSGSYSVPSMSSMMNSVRHSMPSMPSLPH